MVVDGLPTSFHRDASRNGTGWYDRFKIAGTARNDYLIDREAQRARVGGLGFSGIPGRGQDNGMTESMGVIYKRNQEHLGVTDSGIIRMAASAGPRRPSPCAKTARRRQGWTARSCTRCSPSPPCCPTASTA